ncbi:transcription factor HES-4-B-like [Babylonia areolata]|uniref:transcription factor HES-4-B-like n=1 Tax=Babylonia areolata TaxID=304850 RepID=UPI003FD55DE8
MMADSAITSSSPEKNDHSSRKSKKPLMEKRRRARINTCLNQLKALVLQAIKKDSSQFSKLEKADILELTVTHLRTLQRQRGAGGMSSDLLLHPGSKYQAGFSECAMEVSRYMGSVSGVRDEVKDRLLSHLAGCMQGIQPMEPPQPHPHHPPPPPPPPPHLNLLNPLQLCLGPQPAMGSAGVLVHPVHQSPFLDYSAAPPPPCRQASSDSSSSRPSVAAPVSSLTSLQPLSAVPPRLPELQRHRWLLLPLLLPRGHCPGAVLKWCPVRGEGGTCW